MQLASRLESFATTTYRCTASCLGSRQKRRNQTLLTLRRARSQCPTPSTKQSAAAWPGPVLRVDVGGHAAPSSSVSCSLTLSSKREVGPLDEALASTTRRWNPAGHAVGASARSSASQRGGWRHADATAHRCLLEETIESR